MSEIKVSVVCCDDSAAKRSQIVETTVDASWLSDRLIESAEQDVAAGEARGLHNGAIHPEHGAVTYLQEVKEGGFSVFVGDPENLQETFFGVGSFVAFIDSEGPGHASKVGPEGVKRTFRLLKGHIET